MVLRKPEENGAKTQDRGIGRAPRPRITPIREFGIDGPCAVHAAKA
jgi:hypothetical protein